MTAARILPTNLICTDEYNLLVSTVARSIPDVDIADQSLETPSAVSMQAMHILESCASSNHAERRKKHMCAQISCVLSSHMLVGIHINYAHVYKNCVSLS